MNAWNRAMFAQIPRHEGDRSNATITTSLRPWRLFSKRSIESCESYHLRDVELKEQVMKKPAFIPSADVLEGRIALSSGPIFIHGVPVLTRHALGQTVAQIDKAFIRFSHDGMNYNRLQYDLALAVSRIPWNHRDGLLATVESEPAALRADVSTSVSHPVITEMHNTLVELKAFVQSEVASGAIVVR
jgi:hypothetical protein